MWPAAGGGPVRAPQHLSSPAPPCLTRTATGSATHRVGDAVGVGIVSSSPVASSARLNRAAVVADRAQRHGRVDIADRAQRQHRIVSVVGATVMVSDDSWRFSWIPNGKPQLARPDGAHGKPRQRRPAYAPAACCPRRQVDVSGGGLGLLRRTTVVPAAVPSMLTSSVQARMIVNPPPRPVLWLAGSRQQPSSRTVNSARRTPSGPVVTRPRSSTGPGWPTVSTATPYPCSTLLLIASLIARTRSSTWAGDHRWARSQSLTRWRATDAAAQSALRVRASATGAAAPAAPPRFWRRCSGCSS